MGRKLAEIHIAARYDKEFGSDVNNSIGRFSNPGTNFSKKKKFNQLYKCFIFVSIFHCYWLVCLAACIVAVHHRGTDSYIDV